MPELTAALGLVLVIEGAAYALFPDQMRRMMAQALMLPAPQLRLAGLIAAGIGFAIVALVKGL